MLEVLTVGSFCASLFYCLFTGTSILYALIFAFFLFCGYALYRGFSLQEIGKACRQSIAKISNIIIVMLLIGALTASWRASGRPKRAARDVKQVILSHVERHSQKPEEARRRIEALMGDVPRIELFARASPPGWDVWGNEVASDIRLAERM